MTHGTLLQAHGHEGHDTVMYISAAGGCCDCGDSASWVPEGCCPQHQPKQQSDSAKDGAALPQTAQEALSAALSVMGWRLSVTINGGFPSQ